MAFYLNCEICLKLWAECGLRARELRDIGEAAPRKTGAATALLIAASEAIRMHEVEGHPNTGAAAAASA
jgi:hypothetical protein